MTRIYPNNGAGLGSVGSGWVFADRRSQADLADESDAFSNCGSDDGSGWGSDFDSDEEEYFEDLKRRLTEALPYLPRYRAPGQVPTSLAPSSWSESDDGYASAPGTPSPVDGQLPDVIRAIRREFAFNKRELVAYEHLPDAEKHTIPAPISPTFAEMIELGSKSLKARPHPNKPALPTAASTDLLTQVRGFNIKNLKPVDITVRQTVEPSVEPTDDKSPATTKEAWAALNNAIPYMNEDTDPSAPESDIDPFED